MNMSTQVLLVGRGLFQDGLARLLEANQTYVNVIGFAESWQEAKTLLKTLRPDALIADYQCADVIVADLERLSIEEYQISKALFIILDENKMVVYHRQQFVDITIDQLIKAL